MRSTRMYLLLAFVTLALGGFVVYSLTLGQDRTLAPGSTSPGAPALPAGAHPLDRIDTAPTGSSKFALVPPQTQTWTVPRDPQSPEGLRYFSAQAAVENGARWLAARHETTGLFLYGVQPDLNRRLDGDDYLRQISAAVALARAARYLSNEEFAAKATQAVLRFLDDTVTDPKDQQVRCTGPAVDANRLAAAGLLVQAINELPAPQADVLDKSEQLCQFIRRQQQADGSFLCAGEQNADTPESTEAGTNPGQALRGLMASQRNRAADWKIDVVRKAMAFYYPLWKSHRSVALVVDLTPAFAAAFLRTKSQDLADAVLDMNDWLCTLQYSQLDPRHQDWWGGFRSWTKDKVVSSVPTIDGCSCAESLVEACRVARQLGDVKRYDSLCLALEWWRTFATQLQYGEANTSHFSPVFSGMYLLGGFHASPEDGNLRIDYTAQAVCAFVDYLTYIVRNA